MAYPSKCGTVAEPKFFKLSLCEQIIVRGCNCSYANNHGMHTITVSEAKVWAVSEPNVISVRMFEGVREAKLVRKPKFHTGGKGDKSEAKFEPRSLLCQLETNRVSSTIQPIPGNRIVQTGSWAIESCVEATFEPRFTAYCSRAPVEIVIESRVEAES